MRLFLDANVLFSAAKSDGAIRRLLDLALAQRCEMWGNVYVVEEARRNISVKYPRAIDHLESLLARLQIAPGVASDPKLDKHVDWLPEKDRPVLRAAIQLGCDVLVTGDRADFGAGYGKRFGGVMIWSPASLTEYLLR